ncbi:fungal-specific transcription factor domain-containing protein [Diaporthe sp. PMI_573]|nr:fungal-specific transcription factor domain-containing protein [Diaporthaceae sp. PMI_573]
MSEQPQIKRRKGTKHDRTGCLTCRARRKKCVENTLPRCGSCVRLNLECVRGPVTRVPGTPDVPSEMSIAARPPQDALVPGSVHARSPSTRLFMRYYVNFLAVKLTACGYQNSFLSALLPMAMESQTLFDSVVALASGNLSNFNPTYRVPAIEARSRALRNLSAHIARPFEAIHDYETALASCLLLSASDAILGLRTGWSEHLVGARSVIMSARLSHEPDSLERELRGTEAFRGSIEGEWLLRNFAYHDILGSVTSGRPALIPGEYLEGLADTVDSYLGVHSQLLVYVSQISTLNAAWDMLAPDGSQADSEETTDRAATLNQIEQKLRSWHPQSSDPVLEATAYAYKSATVIYLYQRMQATTLDVRTLNSMVSSEVQLVLDNISKIPEDAHPDGILLFPLFMAGGEARNLQDMEIIRSRLRSIDTIRGFRNVLRAREVLEEVWQTRTTATETNSNVDWKDVLRNQGGGLLLT